MSKSFLEHRIKAQRKRGTPIYVLHPNKGQHPLGIVNLLIILNNKEGYNYVGFTFFLSKILFY